MFLPQYDVSRCSLDSWCGVETKSWAWTSATGLRRLSSPQGWCDSIRGLSARHLFAVILCSWRKQGKARLRSRWRFLLAFWLKDLLLLAGCCRHSHRVFSAKFDDLRIEENVAIFGINNWFCLSIWLKSNKQPWALHRFQAYTCIFQILLNFEMTVSISCTYSVTAAILNPQKHPCVSHAFKHANPRSDFMHSPVGFFRQFAHASAAPIRLETQGLAQAGSQ